MAKPPSHEGTGARKLDQGVGRTEEASPEDRLIAHARLGEATEAAQLLKAGMVDINHIDPETGFTALHYAAAYNARPLLRLLAADRRCDFTIADRKGRTAASLAYEVAENGVTGRFLLRKEMHQRRQRP